MTNSKRKKPTAADIATRTIIKSTAERCFKEADDDWIQELTRKGQHVVANEIYAKLRAVHDERVAADVS